ncbi:MAG TPA: Hsp20/alpha crystallin family protein [Gemmataceae bacterium]|nr:Hsp20/alpha crystallin family protein [Gemmataceae bacterium]
MLLTRWQPYTDLWNELNRFQSEMNRLFESFGLGESGWPGLTAAYPAVNIWQDGDNVYCEAELPGMVLDDLEIYVTGGNQLTIKGERKQPEDGKGIWHRQERGFGAFSRTITLPVDVDADKVEARFAHGVLTITMPKSEAARPRRITVKAE